MAKQSGIHQLRGKVGEMSYYRQAGVDAGLVRKINQGMSDRVKTSDEFANTRLNNAEFKHANALAKVAFDSVKPSWRAMFRRFAIASMTKRMLEAIRSGAGNWGERVPSQDLGTLFYDVLENYAKGGIYGDQFGRVTSYMAEITPGGGEFTTPVIQIDLDAAQQTALKAEGIDGVTFLQTYVLAADDPQFAGRDLLEYSKVVKGLTIPVVTTSVFAATPSDIHIDYEDADYSGANFHMDPNIYDQLIDIDNTGCLNVVVMLPFRVVNGVQHVLQERCTFVCYGCGWKALQG